MEMFDICVLVLLSLIFGAILIAAVCEFLYFKD
jgi:hypothetical protein